jgi:uncharacterized protein (DUF1499 family)
MARAQGRRVRIVSILTWLALGLALASVALLLGAPFGYRAGLVNLRIALTMMVPGGTLAGLAAIFVALVRSFVGWRLKTRQGLWLGRAALVVALVAVAFPLSLLQKGAHAPAIHDITTDTADPPVFVAIEPLRADARNSDVYAGESVAQKQRVAYPDIVPILLPVPPEEAFAKSLAAAKALGWQIVAQVPEAGRIEASDTTSWFRFVDDVVIRIRSEGTGSRIDVRSLSRIGGGDIGTNAARIRAFRARLG